MRMDVVGFIYFNFIDENNRLIENFGIIVNNLIIMYKFIFNDFDLCIYTYKNRSIFDISY